MSATTSAQGLVTAWLRDPRNEAKQVANDDKWIATLRLQAADASDPETQANAAALLNRLTH